jgi:hypothetical protein
VSKAITDISFVLTTSIRRRVSVVIKKIKASIKELMGVNSKKNEGNKIPKTRALLVAKMYNSR